MTNDAVYFEELKSLEEKSEEVVEKQHFFSKTFIKVDIEDHFVFNTLATRSKS